MITTQTSFAALIPWLEPGSFLGDLAVGVVGMAILFGVFVLRPQEARSCGSADGCASCTGCEGGSCALDLSGSDPAACDHPERETPWSNFDHSHTRTSPEVNS